MVPSGFNSDGGTFGDPSAVIKVLSAVNNFVSAVKFYLLSKSIENVLKLIAWPLVTSSTN